jgi:hypothetical protein
MSVLGRKQSHRLDLQTTAIGEEANQHLCISFGLGLKIETNGILHRFLLYRLDMDKENRFHSQLQQAYGYSKRNLKARSYHSGMTVTLL